MNQVLYKVTTVKNPDLDDDTLVEELMTRLMNDFPDAIEGYTFERTGPYTINILMWGNIG